MWSYPGWIISVAIITRFVQVRLLKWLYLWQHITFFSNSHGWCNIDTQLHVHLRICVCVCGHKAHEDTMQCKMFSDQMYLRLGFQGHWEDKESSHIYLSLCLFPSPPRFAEYFCINHHDTGKATQFSAPVGKVHRIPKRWHEAWNRKVRG